MGVVSGPNITSRDVQLVIDIDAPASRKPRKSSPHPDHHVARRPVEPAYWRFGVTSPAIRPIAICVFRRDGCVLVGHAHDVLKNEHYCRPPGGAIEFGERALAALRREIREELRTEIEAPVLLGVLENTFQLEGKAKHEIVFVFQARFVDPAFYELLEVPLYEPGWDGCLTWESLDGFRTGPRPLYPEGLLDLLAN